MPYAYDESKKSSGMPDHSVGLTNQQVHQEAVGEYPRYLYLVQEIERVEAVSHRCEMILSRLRNQPCSEPESTLDPEDVSLEELISDGSKRLKMKLDRLDELLSNLSSTLFG